MLLKPDDVAGRRATVVEWPALGRLAEYLGRYLDPMLAAPLYLPDQKALLSRDGGVCVEDGSRLVFDPLSPDLHTCPRCGREFRGERHHRAWIWRYHLWLSERAIHLALLAGLGGAAALQDRAVEIVTGYAELYPRVPNRDNVLGPTRLFFSTYLESVWLLQLLIAASQLEALGRGEARAALEPVARESAGLIASFDEAWSNRQVWNNAALIAAGYWLDDAGLVERGLDGPHGIRVQLGHAVTRDGLWFEGENYHFFALRGFLLAAELLRAADIDLYAEPDVGQRLAALFTAPLDTVLPDLTLPARGDSPYGVSLLQPRFAELWEIGRVRTGDPRIAALLSDMYGRRLPPGPEIGFVEIAEQELNRPAARVSRETLGWKALLWMDPDPPGEASASWQRASTLLEDAGVAVLRTGEGRYVSMECGGRPGGHGHPDLLHLSVFADQPLLADFGTGSYVSPSLHWYRSTLAHNAPGVAGAGQLARAGRCEAFDHDGEWAWCRAAARGVFGPGTAARRTVVCGRDYLVDMVDIEAPGDVVVDLPLHPLAGLEPPRDAKLLDVTAASGPTKESGGGTTAARIPLTKVEAFLRPVKGFTVKAGNDALRLVLLPRRDEGLLLATAAGPPTLEFADGGPLRFLVRRARGAGRWTQVLGLTPGSVREAIVAGDEVVVRLADGSKERLQLSEQEVRIAGRTGRTTVLGGHRRRHPKPAPRREAGQATITCPLLDRLPSPGEWPRAVPRDAIITLGESHYRRSEEPYGKAGPFEAKVAVFAVGSRVCFAADVTKPELCFRASDAPDPALDNEIGDIHSDGLQCYVGRDGWAGYVVVPEAESEGVRTRGVVGTAAHASRCSATWTATERGYAIVIAVDTGRPLAPGDAIPVNLVINEMYPARERRAGQLVLSGQAGWVYLRGDREWPSTATVAEVS
jgi:hypothetical protein